MYFWYILNVYRNTHEPYILHEIHIFASVFICFHCVFTAETCTFGTFHLYTKIHMYHIFYMKCTVLLLFSCVFTVFYLQKHVLLVHFTYIPKYTCTIYSTWNAQFCLCFHVFSLCFYCRNMYFWYISHVYKKHTHVPYILHEMHNFASVFMCFHCVFCVFSIQKHVLLVHFTCITKYTCTIYSTWNAQFCFCFHVFSLCFHCRNMYFWYISHVNTKIHMYHIFYMKCTVLLVFLCVFTVFSLQKHVLLVHVTCIY
jgi:hypothetical protein